MHVVFKFRNEVDGSARQRLLTQIKTHGADANPLLETEDQELSSVFAARGGPSIDQEAFLRWLRSRPEVEYADPGIDRRLR